MLALAQHAGQVPNDVRELTPILATLTVLPEALGAAHTLLADTGYFSAANVEACKVHGLVPL